MSSTAPRYFPRAFVGGESERASLQGHDSNFGKEPERSTARPGDDLINSEPLRSCGSDCSDEALLSLVCERDKEALSLLFRRYARIVRGLAYRVLRDASEADDLLQDIFLLVHRLCGTFDGSKGSARFWILQMTYRRAISRRRYLTSRHFYTHLDLDQAADRLANVPSKSANGNSLDGVLERKQAWESWLAELTESQRGGMTWRTYRVVCGGLHIRRDFCQNGPDCWQCEKSLLPRFTKVEKADFCWQIAG